jgi:hypothetical protein
MDHGPTLWSGPCIHDTRALPASPSTSLQDWSFLPKVAMSDFGCLSCCCHCPPCSTLHLCFLCSWAYSWLYSHSFEREKERIRTLVSYIRYFNQLKYPLRSFSLEDIPGYTSFSCETLTSSRSTTSTRAIITQYCSFPFFTFIHNTSTFPIQLT